MILWLGMALACAMWQGQDERSVSELIQDLRHDSVERRAEAEHELVRRGSVVVPEVKRALERAIPEVRARLLQVVAGIQRQESLREVRPPPTLITLEADNRSVIETLRELAGRVTTPLEYPKLQPELKVTVSFSDVPFWEALDRICKASGKVMWKVEEHRVFVEPAPYVAVPHRVDGSFMVVLEKVETNVTVPPVGLPVWESFIAEIRVAWEKGSKPFRMKILSGVVKDDRGTELSDFGLDPFAALANPPPPSQGISHVVSVSSGKSLASDATRITEFKMVVECEFVLRTEGVAFNIQKEGVGTVKKCDFFHLTLSRFDRSGTVVGATLVGTGKQPLLDFNTYEQVPVFLRDTAGREYRGAIPSASGNGETMNYAVQFGKIPADADLTTLSVEVPVDVEKSRFEIELGDVKLP